MNEKEKQAIYQALQYVYAVKTSLEKKGEVLSLEHCIDALNYAIQDIREVTDPETK